MSGWLDAACGDLSLHLKVQLNFDFDDFSLFSFDFDFLQEIERFRNVLFVTLAALLVEGPGSLSASLGWEVEELDGVWQKWQVEEDCELFDAHLQLSDELLASAMLANRSGSEPLMRLAPITHEETS